MMSVSAAQRVHLLSTCLSVCLNGAHPSSPPQPPDQRAPHHSPPHNGMHLGRPTDGRTEAASSFNTSNGHAHVTGGEERGTRRHIEREKEMEGERERGREGESMYVIGVYGMYVYIYNIHKQQSVSHPIPSHPCHAMSQGRTNTSHTQHETRISQSAYVPIYQQ